VVTAAAAEAVAVVVTVVEVEVVVLNATTAGSGVIFPESAPTAAAEADAEAVVEEGGGETGRNVTTAARWDT